MKQQVLSQSRCADCGAAMDKALLAQDAIGHRTPCPHCGSLKRTAGIVAESTLEVLGLLKPTPIRENEKAHVEILERQELLHKDDIALRKSRRTDKETDRSIGHVTRKDGSGMHSQDHGPAQRKGHGSARKP